MRQATGCHEPSTRRGGLVDHEFAVHLRGVRVVEPHAHSLRDTISTVLETHDLEVYYFIACIKEREVDVQNRSFVERSTTATNGDLAGAAKRFEVEGDSAAAECVVLGQELDVDAGVEGRKVSPISGNGAVSGVSGAVGFSVDTVGDAAIGGVFRPHVVRGISLPRVGHITVG